MPKLARNNLIHFDGYVLTVREWIHEYYLNKLYGTPIAPTTVGWT